MSNFVVAAFYTVNTPYEKEVENLIASCDEHNIDYYVQGYESRGQWVKNAAIKPEFLLDVLDLFPEKDIVYLDADAVIRQYPKLFDEMREDVGVHYRKGTELLSGTIFLRNNVRSRNLLKHWIHYQRENSTTWDQKILQKVIRLCETTGTGLRVLDLPSTYCQIYDTMAGPQPVIEHMQASRRFKRVINRYLAHTIPQSIHGQRIRRAKDGSYRLARNHRKAEEWMDQHCSRCPNQLKWYPKTYKGNPLNGLAKTFRGKRCYIVGKGPSLDDLSIEDFPDKKAPILAINEAIHKVEEISPPNPTFLVQQDAKLKDTCRPEYSKLLVADKAAKWYADEEHLYVLHNPELGIGQFPLSVESAIMVAKHLGTTEFTLICFDSCVNGSLKYAKCVGYFPTWGGKPERFKTHKAVILQRAADTPVEWHTPKGSN